MRISRDQGCPRRPILSPRHKSGNARIATGGRRLRSHRKRCIASIIVTTLAAPKIATNQRSYCAAARPQPSAASPESTASSCTLGLSGVLSSRT
jgi:hypothetical protein